MPVPNHLLPHNPYSLPLVPPVAHKVWILDCRACNMFLTNRGMKAVLLLRPNVSLFSSDALPINCSAYSANIDILPSTHNPNPSPRTCECLTQSLCCHGCGSTIGYIIVVPCIRCTSSITVSNRATNGHRFVFHSNEVSGTERYYVQDEPSVIPFDPLLRVQFPSSPLPDNPARSFNPPLTHRFTSTDSLTSGSRGPSPPLISNFYPVDQKEPPLAHLFLKPGDVIFWHQLAGIGDIPGISDDERARQPQSLKRGREMFNR